MSQQQKRTLTGGTLLVLAVLFIALVVLVDIAFRGLRLDLTENQLYSITEGTENILEGLSEPVNLYFYFSDETSADIQSLRTYANRVREMLEEFEARAEGKIRLEIIDPLPFSEEEDEAAGYGLQAVPAGPNGENVFFGLVGTNTLDDIEVIPFFQLDKEPFLEYDLAKLIHSLDNPDRPVLGLMSSLPMARGFDPATRQMREPWVVVSQLEQLFDVRTIATSAETIEEDIDVLMVAHPKGFSETTQYAIDQFVMRGGNLIVFVDPHAEIDVPQNQMDPQAAMFAERSSDLPALFEAWGIGYDPTKVVLDSINGLQISGGPGRRPVRHIGVLNLNEPTMNTDEVILANLNAVNVALSGYVAALPSAEYDFIPLLTTSEASAPVATQQVQFLQDPTRLLDGFTPTGEQYVIAARLFGPLDSAFPDGPPESDAEDEEATEEAARPEPVARTEEANILVFADADFLADRLWVQVQNFFGRQLVSAFANNGDLVINAVENLSGSSDLISIRGRATSQRPFLKVQELERQAEERFRATEQQLTQQLQETERKLSELQAGREDGNPLILSEEQQAELERFRSEQVRIRKELRSVRANLREDIESLGTWLKVLNIGLMPVLLTALALLVAWTRKRRRLET